MSLLRVEGEMHLPLIELDQIHVPSRDRSRPNACSRTQNRLQTHILQYMYSVRLRGIETELIETHLGICHSFSLTDRV